MPRPLPAKYSESPFTIETQWPMPHAMLSTRAICRRKFPARRMLSGCADTVVLCMPTGAGRYGLTPSSRWCLALGTLVGSGLAVASTLARRLQPRRRHGIAWEKSVGHQKSDRGYRHGVRPRVGIHCGPNPDNGQCKPLWAGPRRGIQTFCRQAGFDGS